MFGISQGGTILWCGVLPKSLAIPQGLLMFLEDDFYQTYRCHCHCHTIIYCHNHSIRLADESSLFFSSFVRSLQGRLWQSPGAFARLQGSKARNHKCHVQVELEPKSHVSPWPSSISQSFVEFANASYASMSQTHEMQHKTTGVNKKQKSSEIHQYETITICTEYLYILVHTYNM